MKSSTAEALPRALSLCSKHHLVFDVHQNERLTFPNSEDRILQVMLTFYVPCTMAPWIITVAFQITGRNCIGLAVGCSGELLYFAFCKFFPL